MIYLSFSGNNLEPTYNLFIGGVSGTITNETQLATYFSFSSGNVTEFAIDGDDIKAFIDTTYSINSHAFNNQGGANDWGNGAIVTYFYESDNNLTSFSTAGAAQFDYQHNLRWIVCNGVTTFGGSAFRHCYSLIKAEFNACTNVQSTFVMDSCYNLSLVQIPICTTLGISTVDNAVFSNTQSFITVITDNALSTANAGSPDGDLVYVTGTAGGTVNYVANTTAPSAITNLAVSTTYGTAFDLTFTPPSSTNTILTYEVWVDGIFKGFLNGSGESVTNLSLNTSYDIIVKTIDIYGNSSESNTVTASTSASYVIPTGDITSSWNFDSDSTDGVGVNDGTDTSMSYVSGGVVSNAADFTAGTSSNIDIADDNSLSFVSSAFSYSFWVKLNSFSASPFLISKRGSGGNASIDREYQVSSSNSIYNVQFVCWDDSLGGYIGKHSPFYPETGVWYHVAISHDGSDTLDGIKIAIDGQMDNFEISSGSYTAMENLNGSFVLGKSSWGTGSSLDGYMDELYLFDSALTRGHMSDIYAKNLSGNTL